MNTNEPEKSCGVATKEIKLSENDINRFWSHVAKDAEGACWMWTGGRFVNGYGLLHLKRSPFVAHRIAWVIANGPIPPRLFVLHKCDNKPCCNPEHLFLGTLGDNNRDRARKGRSAKGDASGSRRWPEKRQRGSGHYYAKLNESKITEIRNRRIAGELLKPLAKEYGVAFATISRIGRGETWRHVSG